MQARIIPHKTGDAHIRVPSSKSLCHRYLIAAGLAQGNSQLGNINFNDDIQATLNVLHKCGISCKRQADELFIAGNGGIINYDGSLIDVGESGSTLRFLLPLLVNSGQEVSFKGHGKLMQRPLSVYQQIIENSGGSFVIIDDILKVNGSFPAGHYEIRGDISSQFISGLLLALPLQEEDSTITIIPPYESKTYVDLTIEVLQKAGITIRQDGLTYMIPGSRQYQPLEAQIPADDSAAAFFAIQALISKRRITIEGMRKDSRQADHRIVDICRQFGGSVQEEDERCSFTSGPLKAARIDLSDCPDLGPILFVLASLIPQETCFINAGRLRLKESDRIEAMKQELSRFAIDMQSDGDTVCIKGRTDIAGGICIDPHGDHRIAMAMAILASIAEKPCIINDAQTVNKSYPDFFQDLIKTDVEVQFL